MRTSDRDRDKTNPHDLANLRKRLWRLSSVLTCGVLVVSLIVTWIASAVTAVKSAGTEMAGAFYWDNRSESLLDVRDRAQPTVFEALNASFEPVNRVDDGQDAWLPFGSAPDSNFLVGGLGGSSFSAAVFEDGSVAFLRPPRNVINDAGSDEKREYWSESTVTSMVEDAIGVRSNASPHLDGQLIEGASMTWLWTTRIEVINPAYSADGADDNSDISFYASGDLSDYSKDGYLAARVFAFVDVSIAVKHLKQLALVLAGAGLLGCALLIFVSRKIIDRALVPVAESQERQREFLIKASHELKTPMASLSSNLDALVANADESVASQAHWTDNMREDIDELADRTCKLLDLVTRAGDEDAGEGADAGGEEVEGAGEASTPPR